MVTGRSLAAASAALVAFALAACTQGDEEGARVPAASTTPPLQADEPSPTATPAPTADPLAGASTDEVSAEPAGSEIALLTAVRAAEQEGFERVVFEFANAVPGYRVGYAPRPITADGSGDEVRVDGAAVLQIRMQGASGTDLAQPEAPATYTGAARLRPATTNVVELARTGDFEGTLSWAIGLRDAQPFRVTTLDGPPRVVIDISAP